MLRNGGISIDSKRKGHGQISAVAKERVNQTISIPGYSGVTAKLVIRRAQRQFEARQRARFRQGGILVKSRHAVHEATLFDTSLDGDPNALWFCGKLSCEYIDDLWNDFDSRFASNEERDRVKPILS